MVPKEVRPIKNGVQVDCDRDPIYGCEEGGLPKICTFDGNATLTTMNAETEDIEQYLDRTIQKSDPGKFLFK